MLKTTDILSYFDQIAESEK